VHAEVKKAAMEAGMLCYPMGGTIDGIRGDHVLLAPPFIVSDDELDLLIQRLSNAVDSAVQSVAR
jgi:adenosylmethionine-8-amino-7-oxononanoate aminotransferase